MCVIYCILIAMSTSSTHHKLFPFLLSSDTVRQSKPTNCGFNVPNQAGIPLPPLPGLNHSVFINV